MAAPYYGWYVVAACATIACFSWGFAFYGLGALEVLAIAGVLWGRALRGAREPLPAG